MAKKRSQKNLLTGAGDATSNLTAQMAAIERIKNKEEAMTFIDGNYLSLIRENYLLSEQEQRIEVWELVAALTSGILDSKKLDVILQLVKSNDWREAVVGIHCAIVVKSILQNAVFHLMFSRLGAREEKEQMDQVGFLYDLNYCLHSELARLIDSETRRHRKALVTRVALLGLTFWQDRFSIHNFLNADAFQSDAIDDYAAAFGAIELLDSLSADQVENYYLATFDSLRDDPAFEQSSFAESKARFQQAARYWMKGLSFLGLEWDHWFKKHWDEVYGIPERA